VTFWIALAAGVVTLGGFAPWSWWPLAVLGPASLLWLWRDATPRAAVLAGWGYGLGLFGAGVSWVYVSLHDFGGMPPVLAGFTVFLLVVYMALFPALAGWLSARLAPPASPARVMLLAPALWVMTEWLRGWLFTGFPWLWLGYSQSDTPLAGFAPVIGALGMGLPVLMTAGAAVMLLKDVRRAWSWAVLAAAVWLGGALLARTDWTEPDGPPRSVVLVQQNVALREKWSPAHQPQIIANYVDASMRADADLVVWPEAAVPYYLDEVSSDLLERLHAARPDVVFGVIERQEGGARSRTYNSVVAISDAGQGLYRKSHLVPFGEFLPLRPVLDWLLDVLHIPMSDFDRFDGAQAPLRAAGVELGISVCYEDAFPWDVRTALPRAQALLNVSEDAWFGDSLAPHQRLQMARLRAREAGRDLLRAANTGPSAVVNHRGEVAAQTPQFTRAVLPATFQPRTGATPYVRLGDWPILVLCAIMIAMGAIVGRRETKLTSST
jgi:apolipoprotein N-acyltransferase